MIKKILAVNLIVLIMFTSCFTDYKKAQASELLIPLAPGAAITVGEAVAWLLGAVGLCAASDAVYQNIDSIKAWGNEQKDKFVGFCTTHGITADNAMNWLTDVCEGTLNKASGVWDTFKSWAASLYPSSINYTDYGFSSEGVDIMDIDKIDYTNDIYNDYYDLANLRFKDYLGYLSKIGVKAIWMPWNINGVEYSALIFYSSNYFEIETSAYYWNHSYELTEGIQYFKYTSILGDIDSLVCPEVPKTHMTYNEIQEYISPVIDFTNIGGISDIYDRDGNLGNYDLVGRVGNGTIADDKVSLDWQSVKDDADTLKGTLEKVRSGELALEDSLADVGVIGLDRVTDKAIDSDKDITNDIPIEQVTTSGEINDYKLNLTDLFPFCLPFDLVDFIKVLRAEPESPKFTWKFAYPTINGMKTADLNVDLAQWNTVALIFRRMELLAFIIGLILITRSKMIRG